MNRRELLGLSAASLCLMFSGLVFAAGDPYRLGADLFLGVREQVPALLVWVW